MSSVSDDDVWPVPEDLVVVTRRNGSRQRFSTLDETTETAAGDTLDHKPGIFVPNNLGLPWFDFAGDLVGGGPSFPTGAAPLITSI